MNIKKAVIIAITAFVIIVVLAIGLSARFSFSNIVDDPYTFIEKFFSQWSLALSAAGTIILAISVFAFIYENRRREEQEKQQTIHAIHNEIHWNLRPIITLRFGISEWQKRVKEPTTVSTATKVLFQPIQTRVFDDMRSRGQLHWLEELRMDVVFCYSLIDSYNFDGQFKPSHLELLTKLHERLDKTIRALEAKFKFLPRYVRYEDTEGTNEVIPNETEYSSRQGEENDVHKSSLNNQEPISFKPLPWGVLFLSFWVSLRSTIENPTLLMQVIEWFFLGLSGILLLAVFTKPLFPFLHRTINQSIPRLSNILTGQNVSGFFISLVFFTTLIGFPTNIIMSWSDLPVLDISISVIGLVLWMIAYLLALVSIASRMGKNGQIIGGIFSALIIWSAINSFKSNVLAGWILVGIGVISIVIVIFRPKSWNLRQMI